MKKFLALLLTVAMVFAMAACSAPAAEETKPAEEGAAAPAEETSDKPAAAGSVYYLNFKPEADAAWQELAKKYTELTGVPVKVVTAASGDYQTTLTSEMDKSEAPTLFQCGNQGALNTWGEYCLDLKDTDFYKEMTTDDFNLFGENGEVLAAGYCYEAFGIIVNKALLEKAGHSIDEITNFETLKAVADDIHARAAELGCTSATFTCAHGLYDYGNVASAEDMAKIAAACAANETFAQVAGSTTYTLGQTNFHSEQRTISSSNPLMDASGAYYKDSVKWVKGGFTTLAGRCAVALAQKDGHTYGLVILGSDSNEHLYSECDELFDWAFASFADRPLVDTQTVVTTVDLTKCRTHPEVELYAAAPVSGYGHADDKVSYSFDLPESVSATVKNGQKLGTATVYLDGCEVGQVDLVTHQEYVSDFRTDSRSTLLLLAALVVILLVLSVVTLACGGGSRNLNRRRRMKRRR